MQMRMLRTRTPFFIPLSGIGCVAILVGCADRDPLVSVLGGSYRNYTEIKVPTTVEQREVELRSKFEEFLAGVEFK